MVRGHPSEDHAQRLRAEHYGELTSIKCNEQVKRYYKRKKEEGKPGLLVLNNIKNKIVHQIFAVVRSQVPYDPAYVHHRAAA